MGGSVPLNLKLAKNSACSPVSSNCVIWQGPDIKCLNLCNGDSVTDVIVKAANELCTLMDMFNLSEFDLSCLQLQPSDSPKNVGELIQILTNKICELNNIDSSSSTSTSTGCPDCIVPIADCFYYQNDRGDYITTMSLTDYALTIGNRICDILSDITTMQSQITTLQEQLNSASGVVARVSTVEQNKAEKSSLYYTVNTNIDPSAGTQYITKALKTIEISLLASQSALGTNTEIYQALVKAGNITNEAQLSSNNSMNALTGWINTVTKTSESIGNLWLTIKDIRTAVKYIQDNYEQNTCSSLYLNLNSSLSANNLSIYVNGSVGFTPDWKECNENSIVTVTDALGNITSFPMKILSYLESITGYVVDLSGSSLNLTTDLTIKINTCFTNIKNNTTCQREYSTVNRVTMSCPSNVLTVTSTTVNYQFKPAAGYTYVVNLYYTGGTSIITSQIISTPGTLVNNTINDLTVSTGYDLELVIVNGDGISKSCTKQTFTTLAS